MEVEDGVERQAAPLQGTAHHSTQEIEFLDDRIVRIRTVYYDSPSDRTGKSFEWSMPDASKIDQLAN